MAQHSNRWTRASFVERYLRAAEVIVVERRRMARLLRSLYMRCTERRGRILDLGCGDGFLTHELLRADPSARATLVDASEEMLRRARERLAGFEGTTFIRASFDELQKLELPRFNFAVSSMALHHLTKSEKKGLLRHLRSLIRAGGYFVNIDLVRAPSEELQEWYLTLWREWIDERRKSMGVKESYADLVERCLAEEHFSRLNTLEEELQLLKEAGFSGVDCFFKHGMFAMYGGVTER
jgi:tRNA (cmo5U34)-methyltransferase